MQREESEAEGKLNSPLGKGKSMGIIRNVARKEQVKAFVGQKEYLVSVTVETLNAQREKATISPQIFLSVWACLL